MEKEQVTQLVIQCQSGDMDAMEQLMLYAYKPVSFQCRKMMKNEQDAEDMTQEVLLTLYEKIGSLSDPAAFHKWLNTITANRCLNALGNPHKEYQIPEDEDGHSMLDTLENLDDQIVPDKALDNAETCRMINEVVRSLPEAQRMCTLMFYFDEMSVKDIAEALAVPENTVKSRLNYARKAIKERVLDYEKQGIKLYSVSPLVLLWFFLHRTMEEESDKKAAAMVRRILPAGAKTAAGALGGAAQAAGSGSAAAAGQTGFWSSLAGFFSGKAAIAAVAAVAVAAAGIGSIAAINAASGQPGAEDVPVSIVEEEEHFHEYTVSEEIAAGCETAGHITFLCSCGDTKEESIPALAHQYLPDEDSDDPNQFICQLCGEILIQEEGTCTHVWKETVHAATCTKDGLRQTVCSLCGYIQPDSTQTIPMDPTLHNWGSWHTTKAATATETGVETRLCSDCGHTETRTLPILEHVHVYTVKTVGAGTCQEPATQTKVCTTCGEVGEETIIAEHSYWLNGYPASCTKGARLEHICSLCSHIEYEYGDTIDPGYHISLIQTGETPQTCSSPAVIEFTCPDCGSIVTRPGAGPDPTLHQIEYAGKYGGNCLSPPYTIYRCKICNGAEERVYGTLNPDAHLPGDIVSDVPASCVHGETFIFQCATCGNTITRNFDEINSNVHDHINTDIFASTCTQDGHRTSQCTDCGRTLSDEPIPATGHNYVGSTVAPTEASQGYTHYVCQICGDSYDDNFVPALAPAPESAPEPAETE